MAEPMGARMGRVIVQATVSILEYYPLIRSDKVENNVHTQTSGGVPRLQLQNDLNIVENAFTECNLL
jgi:hypothetical protein